MPRAWAAPVLALALLLAAEEAHCRSTPALVSSRRQGSQAAAGRLAAFTGLHQLRYTQRKLQQAGSNSSGLQRQTQTQSGDDAARSTSGGSSSVVTAANAATEVVASAEGSARRPIWVVIGGERLDATAAGLEYEDGEEAERSAPADGPLKQPRLPAGLVRRHLKIAPYKADDFAADRAAAWQRILDGQ